MGHGNTGRENVNLLNVPTLVLSSLVKLLIRLMYDIMVRCDKNMKVIEDNTIR